MMNAEEARLSGLIILEWKGGEVSMVRSVLETTDIFMGAFLLCMGGCLCGIRIKDTVKGIAAFRIEGEDLDRLDRDYRTGKARVNPVSLRESLNMLRDVLFEFQGSNTRYGNRKNRGQKGIR